MCPFNRRLQCGQVAAEKCDVVCRQDCRTSYYDVFIDDKVKVPKVKPWDKMIGINLRHSPLPDQMVEHSPEMSFISFIANMGGLIGMWLGLSAYAILQTGLNLL